MKPSLPLCTYLCVQIGPSLYPLIIQVHLQIQIEHGKKKSKASLQNPDVADVGCCPTHGQRVMQESLILVRMVLPSAILIPDFPLSRTGNTLPEHTDNFFFLSNVPP